MQYNIFTDGSYKKFDDLGEFYGSATIVLPEWDYDKMVTMTKAGNEPEYIALHNVAGEILAVMMAMEHCLNVLKVNQDDELHIYHDYVGISNWVKSKGEQDYWKAKKPITQAYANYMNTRIKTTTKVVFHHVPGHSGHPGNDLVDQLAKQAIDYYVENLRKGLQ